VISTPNIPPYSVAVSCLSSTFIQIRRPSPVAVGHHRMDLILKLAIVLGHIMKVIGIVSMRRMTSMALSPRSGKAEGRVMFPMRSWGLGERRQEFLAREGIRCLVCEPVVKQSIDFSVLSRITSWNMRFEEAVFLVRGGICYFLKSSMSHFFVPYYTTSGNHQSAQVIAVMKFRPYDKMPVDKKCILRHDFTYNFMANIPWHKRPIGLCSIR